jgi:SMODS-associating 2TM, beta-strand rich effector domain
LYGAVVAQATGGDEEMHEYSQQRHQRGVVFFALALIAITLTPQLSKLGGWIGYQPAITSFSLFGLVSFLFNRFAWRWPLIRKVIAVPDLSGKWNITGSNFDSEGRTTHEWTGTAYINQTWTQISVALTTDTSRSRSGSASLEPNDGHGTRLIFSYLNEPNPGPEPLTAHRGTCDLMFADNCQTATGTYFNDFQRRSYGKLDLTKVINGTKE